MARVLRWFGALLLGTAVGFAGKVPPAEWILNNSAQGREFWIAIPPNEVDGYPGQLLEFYVTSSYNTEVTLYSALDGRTITKPVRAMEITTFSLLTGDLSWSYEVRESEVVTQKGIRLSAPHPISVYVLNGKQYTSDGYLALPVNVWGTEYMHLSYYDYEDFMQKRGNGFVVIAAEDQTVVRIQLYGRGYGRTVGGRRIGQSIEVVLNRGQTYMVRGTGDAPLAQNDFSGTRIVSNKPIGLISFHMRTPIPSSAGITSRDHLVEMLPPISAWGKRYVTIEYQRKARKGDFFRLLASQPNTSFTVRWYRNGQLRGSFSGRLQNPGDFWEYNQTTDYGDSSIYGQSIWEANKPVLLMHYSYSAIWDGDVNFDPFMIVVTPVEQYIRSTVFQTPASKAFATNYFNLIAIGDTNDPSQQKLRSIKVDGQPVWARNPEFLGQRIPGTNLYWVVLRMQPGPHKIIGETPFGGYIYGFSQWDSYGWPAAMAINKIDELDTLPPELRKRVDCGDWEIEATELRNGKPEDNPRQVDQGIAQIELLEGSYNYRLRFITAEELKPYPKVERFVFRLEVIDKRSSAFARIGVLDRAGNLTIDSVWYNADSLIVRPADPVDFGAVRLGQSRTLPIQLFNARDSAAALREIRLQAGRDFMLLEGAIPPNPATELAGKAAYALQVRYTPSREHPAGEFDRDTLIVRTACAEFRYELRGRGIQPHIWVEDWDAGIIPVNTSTCKDAGLLITNPGTDTLHISAIEGVTEPFQLNLIEPPLPIQIPPGARVLLRLPCYAPTAVGEHQIAVTFRCDAPPEDKNVSIWRGRATVPGPYITSYDWGERRVGTRQDALLYIRNAGAAPALLTEVRLRGLASAGTFAILSIEPQPGPGTPVRVEPQERSEVKVRVQYIPPTEEVHLDSVEALFSDGTVVVGSVRGIGILPKIEVAIDTFPCILVGQHQDGIVSIHNPSSSAELFIERIDWAAGSDPDFRWVTPPPSNLRLGRGQTLQLPFRFAPQQTGPRQATVLIRSDAAPGPDPNPIVETRVRTTGSGCVNDIQVTNLDFGAVLTCDEPIGSFQVINPNDAEITVEGLELVGGDVNAFELLSPTPADLPVQIPAGERLTVQVRFLPKEPRQYSATVAVRNRIRPELTAQLRGEGYRVPTAYRVLPERLFGEPGQRFDASIQAESPRWATADVRTLQARLTYNGSLLQYVEGSIRPGSLLDATWQVNAQEVPGPNGTSQLLISASGQTPIGRDGELFRFQLQSFLGVLLRSDLQLEVDIGQRAACVDIATTPATAEVGGCFVNGRLIRLSPAGYFLQEIRPNPVAAEQLELVYGVGMDGWTRVELFTAMGTRVATLVEGILPAGTYQQEVNIAELPAGSYIVRIISGPFSATQRFVRLR
jgi:hypothetical protein